MNDFYFESEPHSGPPVVTLTARQQKLLSANRSILSTGEDETEVILVHYYY